MEQEQFYYPTEMGYERQISAHMAWIREEAEE
jgi:hypothetical protein